MPTQTVTSSAAADSRSSGSSESPSASDAPSAASGIPAAFAADARPWRTATIIGSATWLAAAVTYLLVTVLSWMIPDKPGPAMSRLYQAWDHWDTGYYMRISQLGYTADRSDTHAFFPLYPILLRCVDAIVPGPTLVATLVLANMCCLGALVVLHRFVASEFGSTVASRTLLFLMAFPTAFFLSAGYNASLFLLLSVSALYCLRSGLFWSAGAIGALASATRLTGALLVLPFVIEYARQRGWRLPSTRASWRGVLDREAAAVLLIPAGVGAFAMFCWVQFGHPLDFLHAQRYWGRHFAMPWDTFGEALGVVSRQPMVLYQATLHNIIDIAFAAIAIVLLTLCVVGPWRFRRDQLFLVAYSGAVLLSVLVGPNAGLFPMMSVPRYVLELVPAFILLARLGASRVFERIYLLPAVGLQAVFLLTFLNNVWIA